MRRGRRDHVFRDFRSANYLILFDLSFVLSPVLDFEDLLNGVFGLEEVILFSSSEIVINPFLINGNVAGVSFKVLLESTFGVITFSDLDFATSLIGGRRSFCSSRDKL